MKKVIFGIFAHPDDEAFGPAGTLLLETKAGTELHLITLTAGEAGTNEDDIKNLGEHRLKEWQRAGALLGATSMHYFGYKDGHLDNHDMVEIADRIVHLVGDISDGLPHDASIEFMGFDFSGLSGHIDHIVATRAACLAFYRLRDNDSRFARMRLACLPKTLHPKHNVRWLYMEQGRDESEIDEVIDARELRDDIIAIMGAHASQRIDFENYLKIQGENLGLNYFVIKT